MCDKKWNLGRPELFCQHDLHFSVLQRNEILIRKLCCEIGIRSKEKSTGMQVVLGSFPQLRRLVAAVCSVHSLADSTRILSVFAKMLSPTERDSLPKLALLTLPFFPYLSLLMNSPSDHFFNCTKTVCRIITDVLAWEPFHFFELHCFSLLFFFWLIFYYFLMKQFYFIFVLSEIPCFCFLL